MKIFIVMKMGNTSYFVDNDFTEQEHIKMQEIANDIYPLGVNSFVGKVKLIMDIDLVPVRISNVIRIK